MLLFAIDPGLEQSAWMLMKCGPDVKTPMRVHMAISENQALLENLRYGCEESFQEADVERHLAIEMVASYGMPVGRDIFETVLWSGRFIEAFGGEFTKVYRRDVKLHLCGSAQAKDAHIRQALIDRFGPGKEKAIGNLRHPGPLYGMRYDLWAALAVAVTWIDHQEMELDSRSRAG